MIDDNKINVALVNFPKEEKYERMEVGLSLQGKDFFIQERFAGGQQTLAISSSPLDVNTNSSITFNEQIKPSFFNEYAISLSQRVKGITSYMEVVDTDVYNETFQEFNIVSLSQVTTTLSITLDSKFDGGTGYWVDIYGLTDNRFNYGNLVVSTISADKKTLTCFASEDASITSLTATPASVVGGKLKCQTLGSANFARIKFGAATAGQASFQSRFNKGLLKSTGILGSAHAITIGNTASTYTNTSAGQVELKPISRYKIGLNEDSLRFMDSLTDVGALDTVRATFTEVKPSFFKNYRNRMRIASSISASRPVARIVSAVKATSTTTATITIDTTCEAVGLVTGSYVTIKGIRDQTNFANLAVPNSITVTGTSTFTVSCGIATIATSYGGAVILANCSQDQPGIIAQSCNSISRNSTGLVAIVGNGTWTGLNVGEYVDLYGCLDNTGSDLELDGTYRVNSFATNNLVLEPIKNLDGTYVLDGNGNQVTKSGNVVDAINCGGAIILRTTMRMHDITSVSYSKQMVQFEGQGINDLSLAIPVMFPASQSVMTTNGFNSSSGLGGVMVNPTNGSLTDIASGAITSTVTSATLLNTHGNGFQISIPVTAVTGTNSTLDVSVEESYDGGTNWVKLYDFQRITATGSYNSPMLRAQGGHVRYVRTITGTTPSFTMSLIRNIRPMITAEPQKRLLDRSIVLTTLNSLTPTLFQGSANNVQLVLNLGSVTTAPVIQLEGSEDNINWYTIGTTLTGVANSTVQLTVNSISATYTRARVSTAGTAVTIGYVGIKAWS